MTDYNKIITTLNSVTNEYTFLPDPNNVIVIDTSNNRIGINTNNPNYSLDISNGDARISNILKIGSENTNTNFNKIQFNKDNASNPYIMHIHEDVRASDYSSTRATILLSVDTTDIDWNDYSYDNQINNKGNLSIVFSEVSGNQDPQFYSGNSDYFSILYSAHDLVNDSTRGEGDDGSAGPMRNGSLRFINNHPNAVNSNHHNRGTFKFWCKNFGDIVCIDTTKLATGYERTSNAGEGKYALFGWRRAGGVLGVNNVFPKYNLDVCGAGHFTDVVVIDGSMTIGHGHINPLRFDYKLDVSGDAQISGDLSVNNLTVNGILSVNTTNFVILDSNNTFNGDISFNGLFNVNTNIELKSESSNNYIALEAGHNNNSCIFFTEALAEGKNLGFIMQYHGSDAIFRISSTSDNITSSDTYVDLADSDPDTDIRFNHALSIDRDTGSVGIKKDPDTNYSLDVSGDVFIDGDLSINGNLTVSGNLIVNGRLFLNPDTIRWVASGTPDDGMAVWDIDINEVFMYGGNGGGTGAGGTNAWDYLAIRRS